MGKWGGHAGAGAVLYAPSSEGGRAIWAGTFYVGGHSTNNVAEYRAAILGLLAAAQVCDVQLLRCRGDSQLVVMQAAGRWRVRQVELLALRDELLDAAGRLSNSSGPVAIEWEHIDRNANWRADVLANRAIDSHLGEGLSHWETWNTEAEAAVSDLVAPASRPSRQRVRGVQPMNPSSVREIQPLHTEQEVGARPVAQCTESTMSSAHCHLTTALVKDFVK